MAPLLRNDPVGQTIDKMNELLKEKYVEEKEDLYPKLKKNFCCGDKTSSVPGREGLARY